MAHHHTIQTDSHRLSVVAIVQLGEHWSNSPMTGHHASLYFSLHKFQTFSTIDGELSAGGKLWGMVNQPSLLTIPAGPIPVIWRNSVCGAYTFAIIQISACARQPNSTILHKNVKHYGRNAPKTLQRLKKEVACMM